MMTTDLATLATHDQAMARLIEKADLIRQTVAPDATDQELELFFEQCVRLGLDPIIRQAYWIKRQGRGTLQVGIDGLRSIADRTGNYVGSDDPVFVDDADNKPVSASVTVWKWAHGQRCPFSATARWSEYAVTNSPTWSRMPHVMLAKVAEAAALRKAFPSQLVGAYINEEMDQADAEPAPMRPIARLALADQHIASLNAAKDLPALQVAWNLVLGDKGSLSKAQLDGLNTLKEERKAALTPAQESAS